MPYKSHNTSRNGAVHHGRLFLFPMFYESGSEGIRYNKEKGWRIQAWHTGNYRAKLANASFRTARSGLAVSGKIILTALRYFSRKPCLTGSIYRRALVVQRAAKARVFTIKINSHEPSICHKRATGSHEDAHARNKKKENRGTRTGCQVPATGDDRTGTRFHIVEPHSGNMPPSRQEQAAGGIIQ